MSKVRCKLCANENNGICSSKKIGVKPNKPRNCEVFVLDESKDKPKQDIPVYRFGFKEQQEEKKRRKEDLELAREHSKKGIIDYRDMNDVRKVVPNNVFSNKHPLTGDLSRFMTTATKRGE
jgi:hypothetical protein